MIFWDLILAFFIGLLLAALVAWPTRRRRFGARWVVLAVPVCASDTATLVGEVVDEVVCVASPEAFHAVGHWYRDFSQTRRGH